MRALQLWEPGTTAGAAVGPWGTYLACEKNFNGYFSSSDPGYKIPTSSLRRYGVKTKDWGYGWAREDERFDVSRHRNEPDRFGYVVEIDPRRSAPDGADCRPPVLRFKLESPIRAATSNVYRRQPILITLISDLIRNERIVIVKKIQGVMFIA